MRLLQLSLTNYQGIPQLVIKPMSRSITISGPNGSGKSTIASALSWLLTGKSASGEKGYSPKPLDTDGNEIHHLTTSAEAVFQVSTGEELIISKELKENWRKKGGLDEFTGNTVCYYINGDPVTEKVYKDTLSTYFTADESMILTIPSYFAEELEWAKRREMLLRISGGITDKDIIASDERLNRIPEILEKAGNADAGDALISLQKKEKALRAERDKIQPRIDEAMVAMPDVSALDAAALNEEAEKESRRRSELSERLAALSSDDTANVQNRKRLSEIEAEFAEKKAAYAASIASANKDAEDRIEALTAALSEKTKEKRAIENELRHAAPKYDTIKAKRDDLLEHYKALQKEKAKLSTDTDDYVTECPYCHQTLPEDILTHNREEHLGKLAAMREENEKKIASALSVGSAFKERLSELEVITSELTDKLCTVIRAIDADEAALEEANKLVKTFEPFSATDEAKALLAEADRIRAAMSDASASQAEAENSIRAEIRASEARSAEIVRTLSLFTLRDAQEKRIAELLAEGESMAEEIKETLIEIKLVQLFIQTRARMLDEKISSMFNGVRFRLTEVLINGSIRECCEPIVKSKNGWMPYTQASTAERIRGGLEIIRVLSNALDKEMPVVIDNAEAVLEFGNMGTMQLIKLYVKDTMSGELEIA